MAESANALAPKMTGVNRLIDWAAQKVNPTWFPTSARTLFETVQGNRDPITETNFSPAELDVMRQLIESTGDRGHVQYADYINFMKKQQQEKGTIPASMTPSMLSILDPIGNVQNTLGRFTYSRDSQGNLIVVDSYDFNKQGPSTSSVIGAIRDYASEKIPPGSGRQVNINLGR